MSVAHHASGGLAVKKRPKVPKAPHPPIQSNNILTATILNYTTFFPSHRLISSGKAKTFGRRPEPCCMHFKIPSDYLSKR
jgi:hypothetical protein